MSNYKIGDAVAIGLDFEHGQNITEYKLIGNNPLELRTGENIVDEIQSLKAEKHSLKEELEMMSNEMMSMQEKYVAPLDLENIKLKSEKEKLKDIVKSFNSIRIFENEHGTGVMVRDAVKFKEILDRSRQTLEELK